MDFPFYSTSITLGDLEVIRDDSLIVLEEIMDGDSLFVYKKSIDIDKVTVGDKLNIDDIQTSFSQNIEDVTVESIEKNISSIVGPISLSDIDPQPTDPYAFSDIFPQINNLPDGVQDIPGFDLEPVTNPFSFDDFSEASFSSGSLTLTIVNDLVIPLGDVLVALKQVNGSDTTAVEGGSTTILGPIQPNSTGSGVLDLTGMSLPGNILVEVTGSSPGASNVTIDDDARNSSFSVQISASVLEVSSATAKIPEQTITETGMLELAPDSNKVVEAVIQAGNLEIQVDNYMAVSSELTITIPSLQTNEDEDFSTTIQIEGNTLEIVDQTNLTNYSLVMDADDQSVGYNYAVLTMSSGDDLVQISSDDSINVSIKLTGETVESDLQFSEFTGYLSQDAMTDSSEIELDDSTRVETAILQSGMLSMTIQNNIGIMANVFFQIDEFVKDAQSMDTTFSIQSGESLIDIDLTGYELVLPMDVEPQRVHYLSTISLPEDELMTISLNDSIGIDVVLSNLSFESITGAINPVEVQIDTVEQSIDALPTELEDFDFSTVEIEMSFNSSIDLPIYLTLTLEAFNDSTGATFSQNVMQNIHANPNILIEDAAEMINIRPHRIVATGFAEVGHLDSVGTVGVSDSLVGQMVVRAPLTFEIDGGADMSIDASEMDSVIMPEVILESCIYLDYQNELDFGLNLTLLIAEDSTAFENGLEDTLVSTFSMKQNQAGMDSIVLSTDKFELLGRPKNYIKPIITLSNSEDGPIRFTSTDTLSIDLRAKITIDGSELLEDE